jgi:hypothetical protein
VADTAGDKHPRKRAYREAYRPQTARARSRTKDWRESARELLGKGYPNTVELWRGPSQIDGAPIVVLATGLRKRPDDSVNVKTGDMVGIYILPQLVDPREAIDTGADRAVCGSCPHRPGRGGDCYVQVAWAPRNLWLTWFSGGMPLGPVDLFRGAAVRFGAWGDPAAVPLAVWDPLLEIVRLHTGYTQRWRDLDVSAWGWLMASVTSAAEAEEAQRAGWRSFRVVYRDSEPELPSESQCAAASDGVTCVSCGACNGDRSAGRGSIWLAAHGFRSRSGRLEPGGGR